MSRPGTPRRRRGTAMLLVMASLAITTVLATSYLAVQDITIPLGRNVNERSVAHWAAMTGLELGIAALETEANLWKSHPDGHLLRRHALDNALVDLHVIDRITGLPPDEFTMAFTLTASATVGMNLQECVAHAMYPSIPSGEDSAASVDSFALFGMESVTLSGSALVTRWPDAPASILGERIPIGTQSTMPGAIHIHNQAVSIDTTAYIPPGAGPGVIQNTSSSHLQAATLPAPVRAYRTPHLDQIPAAGRENHVIDAGRETLEEEHRFKDLSIVRSGQLTLQGRTRMVTRHLKILGRGTLIIDGNSIIVVHGDLVLDRGQVQLVDDAHCLILVSEDVHIHDSYLGNTRPPEAPGKQRDHGDEWMKSSRLQIRSIPHRIRPGHAGEEDPAGDPEDRDDDDDSDDDDGDQDRGWTITGRSIVKCDLLAPNVPCLRIRDQVLVCGRVLGHRVFLSHHARLLFDPGIHPGAPMLVPTSPAAPSSDDDSTGPTGPLDDPEDACTPRPRFLDVTLLGGAVDYLARELHYRENGS